MNKLQTQGNKLKGEQLNRHVNPNVNKLLEYNHIQGEKLRIQGADRMKGKQLNRHINPHVNKLLEYNHIQAEKLQIQVDNRLSGKQINSHINPQLNKLLGYNQTKTDELQSFINQQPSSHRINYKNKNVNSGYKKAKKNEVWKFSNLCRPCCILSMLEWVSWIYIFSLNFSFKHFNMLDIDIVTYSEKSDLNSRK